MNYGTDLQRAHRDYLESHILSAQPVVIVEMLYQVAIGGVEAAIGHLRTGNALARSAEVSRAQDAINELTLALDHSAGASFTATLASLYAYAQEEILKGHVKQSEPAFRNAISALKPLLEAWSEVCKRESQKVPETFVPVYSAPTELEQEVSAVTATDQRAAYQPDQERVSRDWSC